MKAVRNNVVNIMQVAYRKESITIPIKVSNSLVAVQVFKSKWDIRTIPKHERVYAIFMNSEYEIIAVELINIGGYDETILEERTIIEFALTYNAPCLVIAHNHPSGVAKPSQDDIGKTKAIKRLLSQLKINLCDHLIITETDDYYSFSDNKILN